MKHTFNLPTILLLLLAMTAATAQKKDQPWTDWSKKDAEKMLAESAWAQTQIDTDTSELFYSPTANAGSSRTNAERSVVGAVNSAVDVKFHVRFLSARPIRQALARIVELQRTPPPEVIARLHSFAELKSTDSIIVTLSFESPDQRYSGAVMQEFNSAITATMKNDSYLERSDGKRLFLEEYVAPGKDGFGARFIFMREVNGQPFIDANSGEVRFHAQYPNGLKIDRRFKVANMVYAGALEY